MIKNKLKPKGAIKDFIWTKENTLSKEFCDHVIKKFDADPSKQDGIVGAKIQRVDKKLKDTKDITITRQPNWADEDKVFYDSLNLGLEEYNNYLYNLNKDCCRGFPNPTFGTSDTGYKVQKYEPDGFYDWHHDWSMTASPVASRIYTFMWYLNTIEEKDDGYTEFVDGTKIQPVAGKLIMFPATWTYLHRGYPPKVKKYLCNGWIHAAP
tara:strand:- start:90 stop:716 length:627 start_codon:yes stop_codon:yes gene_type:complete